MNVNGRLVACYVLKGESERVLSAIEC